MRDRKDFSIPSQLETTTVTISSYFGDPSGQMLKDFGEKEVGVKWEQPADPETVDFDFIGIIVHTWNDCMQSPKWPEYKVCVHLIQVKNACTKTRFQRV